MTAPPNDDAGWRAGIVKRLEQILAGSNCTQIQTEMLLSATVAIAVEISDESAAFELNPRPEMVEACDAISDAAELLTRCVPPEGGP